MSGDPQPNDGGAEPPDRLLTAAEVGDLLGVPASWVLRASRNGELPTVRIGRYRRYRRSAIRKWMAEQER